jgi:pSer/pThr/pTyr-binding forkhead associated (FHA) protein
VEDGINTIFGWLTAPVGYVVLAVLLLGGGLDIVRRRRLVKPSLPPLPPRDLPAAPQTEVWQAGTGESTEKWVQQAGAKARLTLLEGAGMLPPTIYINNENTAFGRDGNYADVVLKHKNVSRFHCRILEKQGVFTVMDEGSPSGTYINGDRVDIRGQQLKSGDILQFGPIQYRFEVLAQSPPAVAQPAYAGDSTEQWIAQPNAVFDQVKDENSTEPADQPGQPQATRKPAPAINDDGTEPTS